MAQSTPNPIPSPPSDPAPDLFEDMRHKVDSTDNADSPSASPSRSKLVEEIESLCMNCHDNGTTRLLLTRIPFFREIVIMSFSCPWCGLQNAEVQPAGQIQPRGIGFTLRVEEAADLGRQVVKSDTCRVRVDEIDLEIPPGRGQLTNVEGLLRTVAADLRLKQHERRLAVPETWARIEHVVARLDDMAAGVALPFTLDVDDPAGNAWIQFQPGDGARRYARREYARSPAQNEALGLAAAAAAADDATHGPDGDGDGDGDASMRAEYHANRMVPSLPDDGATNNVDDAAAAAADDDDIREGHNYAFISACPGCASDAQCVTNMRMLRIPHFKEVVIMATCCDRCGYRSNEVKSGVGEIPERGRRITLRVRRPADLSRDVLKSETCALQCPELKLCVQPGSLGGRFTTVEGLLAQVRADLRRGTFADAGAGDSMTAGEREKWEAFFGAMDRAIEGTEGFTLVLEDPFAASYVQSFADEGPDEQITVEDYERSAEEEEELGLRDIKTEDYGDGVERGEVEELRVDERVMR